VDAPSGDIRIKLMSAGREPLLVLSVQEHRITTGNQERTGLQKVARRIFGELIAPRDPQPVRSDVQTRPQIPHGASNATEGRTAPPTHT
jgi:hypothetical protein